MNAHNTTPTYMPPGHAQAINYGQPPPVPESIIDKAYVTSIRGILKFGCLVIKLFYVILNILFCSYYVLLHSFV
jgi:hypothetical protein